MITHIEKGGNVKDDKRLFVFSEAEEEGVVLTRRLTHSLPCHAPLASAGCSLRFGFIQKGQAEDIPISLLLI